MNAFDERLVVLFKTYSLALKLLISGREEVKKLLKEARNTEVDVERLEAMMCLAQVAREADFKCDCALAAIAELRGEPRETPHEEVIEATRVIEE